LKPILAVVCLAALCPDGAHAEEPGRAMRRITLAASCAASFWDYGTTAVAARYGATERNALMADSNGHPRLGLLLGVKAGICAATAVLQEAHVFGRKRDRFTNTLWTSINGSLAARFAGTAVHNLTVLHSLQQQANPAVPAHLAPTQ
jgi:hypothetical protein